MRYCNFLWLVFIILSNHFCYSQIIEKNLYGAWILGGNTLEFYDMILFRSDNKYFIFNPNSADSTPDTIGKNTIIFSDGSYDAISETGSWTYKPDKKTLILKNRNITREWTDFSEAYSKESELVFSVNFSKNNTILTLCHQKNKCDDYEKMYSYKQIKIDLLIHKVGELKLSGYETEIKIIEKSKNANFIIKDDKKKIIYNSKEVSKKTFIPIRGIRKLFIENKSHLINIEEKVKIGIEIM